MGQTKQNKQQARMHQPEPDTSSPTSKLSDADYEFLFNQLLEGIAHGWHDRRIVKFFKQLDDRGQEADWVSWLEKTKDWQKLEPIQSKRQLGTIMIRLAELTQSATEVSKISLTCNRIGRELLFGNVQSLIWEYVGPDLIIETNTEAETEFAQRLPADFNALSSLVEDPPVFSNLETASSTHNEELPESAPSLAESETQANRAIEKVSPTDNSAPLSKVEISRSEDDPDKSLDRNNLWDESSESSENQPEFERSNLPKPVGESESVSSSPEIANGLDYPAPPLSAAQLADTTQNEAVNQMQLANALDALEDDVLKDNVTDRSPGLEVAKSDSASPVNMQQIMQLIQTDEELAQQISQKLNLTRSPESGSLPNKLDKSSLELIESWFNLGLKHVSAGEYEKAIAAWEKALKINAHLPEAWHNRGSALGRLGKYEAAVKSFQSALAIDPYNYQAWNDRAHALYQLQSWSAAVDSWGHAIKIMPGNHLFWYNRGCALEQLEQWQEAIASYEKALEIKPDFQPGRSRYINLIADNSSAN